MNILKLLILTPGTTWWSKEQFFLSRDWDKILIYKYTFVSSFSSKNVLHHLFYDPTPPGGVNRTVLNPETGTR